MDFDSLQPDQPAQAAPQDQQAAPQDQQAAPQDQQSATPIQDGNAIAQPSVDFDSLQDDSEKYGTTGQQAIAGLEGAAKGIAGPLATLGETKLLGVKPEDITGRAEANPWTHGLGELGGFGAGIATGTGLPGLVSGAGKLAVGAAGLGEAATIGSKLAAGALSAATEMGLIQSGDEVSKAILNAPQTMGSVVSNIGLSAALGGITGGALTGVGAGLKAAFNNSGLKDFVDRLAFRKANIDPAEMAKNELQTAHNTVSDMGTEVGGIDGVKSQAIAKLIPEMNPKIHAQASDLLSKMDETVEKMRSSGDKAGAADDFQAQADKLREALNPNTDLITNQSTTPLDSKNIFDTMNGVKRQLGEWGQFNKAFTPFNEIQFRSAAKGLGSGFKEALEDGDVWGKAGDLQKSLNSAWSDLIPAQKDIQSKFMEKVGGQPTVSPQKFQTYLNQNGKATSTSIRQQMMGNYVEAVPKFQDAVSKAYEAAGVENPFQPVGMSALSESLGAPSTGSKLADLWTDKLGAHTLGSAAGAGIGGAIGHAVLPGYGGFVGASIGREVGGPVFSAVLKPVLEKYPDLDLGAFKQALALGKNIVKGNQNLANAVSGLFEASGKVLSPHLVPSASSLLGLDERAKEMNGNLPAMANVGGSVGTYLPDHATAIGQGTSNAVNYINSQRPTGKKAMPLDEEQEPSAMDKANFQRTLTIAQQPLMVMQHIKDGTVLPQDVAAIKAIYPDYYQHMSQQIMSGLVDHTTNGGTVPYKVRQGMSLFLGQPLDSTMTPTGIQAAQKVFMNQKNQQQAPQAPPKKSAAKLDHSSDDHLTQDQSAQKRMTAER